jgi:hypothetical protein
MTKILSNKSNIDLDYPICRPSLDLDFTQEVLDPRITFSRGSIGTRVNSNRLIETVSANLPRFDYDPVTGECKGLLIEESRSNLLVNSDDFNSWAKNNYNVSTNVITAPDGTLTADKIIPINSNTFHDIFKTPSLSSNTYTLSIFAKAAEQSFIRLRIDGGLGAGTFFNLSNGSIGSSVNVTSSTITPYPNGWYRCSITVTTNIINVVFNSFPTGSTTNYTGNGTSGLYLWGAQLEQGAFPTSYIPTTASIVTRSADRASMGGTNFSSWYNQSEGSIVTTYQKNSSVSGYNFGVFSLTSSLSNRLNVIDFFPSAFTIYCNGNPEVYEFGGPFNITTKSKSAFSFATNKFFKCTDGTFYLTSLAYPIASGIKIPTVNTLVLGPYWGGVQPLNGTISRLTYYPRALKPNQLQFLTT